MSERQHGRVGFYVNGSYRLGEVVGIGPDGGAAYQVRETATGEEFFVNEIDHDTPDD